MGLVRKIAIGVVLGAVGTLVVALGLIASERPVADLRAERGEEGLAFERLAAGEPAPRHQVRMRDGASLGVRRWESGVPEAPLLVALHGSGWHGAQFDGLGPALAGRGLADVIAPDLRGHGPNPERRGDIDYIAQIEDDLADLISAERRAGQQVVMLGHSSGGGMVLRFAGGAYGGMLDGAILLAPFVQHDAPTTRAHSGGWARVLMRRIIGLTMLNTVGVTQFNHLTVLQFRFPDVVLDGPMGDTATRAYSYRLMTGFNPRRNWGADIAALPVFLLIAGEADEAFVAEAYEPAMSAHSADGRYVLLPGVGHLDVVGHPQALAAITRFMETHW